MAGSSGVDEGAPEMMMEQRPFRPFHRIFSMAERR